MPADLHPLRYSALAHGRLAWREAGANRPGPALVFLHGIGSGAGAWQAQLEDFGRSQRVLAWDAPGYGDSDPLACDAPLAHDFAQVLGDGLRDVGVTELILVGHSLGALVASAWAAAPTASLRGLVLASPARGYGRAAADVRASKYQERLQAIQQLGPAGLAQSRAAHLCAPGAPDHVLAVVRAAMSRVTPRGYMQAAFMLAHDDLLSRLQGVNLERTKGLVLCGSLDRVTRPEDCAALARATALPYVQLDGVAHACYVESPPAFNGALREALGTSCLAAENPRSG